MCVLYGFLLWYFLPFVKPSCLDEKPILCYTVILKGSSGKINVNRIAFTSVFFQWKGSTVLTALKWCNLSLYYCKGVGGLLWFKLVLYTHSCQALCASWSSSGLCLFKHMQTVSVQISWNFTWFLVTRSYSIIRFLGNLAAFGGFANIKQPLCAIFFTIFKLGIKGRLLTLHFVEKHACTSTNLDIFSQLLS